MSDARSPSERARERRNKALAVLREIELEELVAESIKPSPYFAAPFVKPEIE